MGSRDPIPDLLTGPEEPAAGRESEVTKSPSKKAAGKEMPGKEAGMMWPSWLRRGPPKHDNGRIDTLLLDFETVKDDTVKDEKAHEGKIPKQESPWNPPRRDGLSSIGQPIKDIGLNVFEAKVDDKKKIYQYDVSVSSPARCLFGSRVNILTSA
jgi:hypothetical protein